MHIYATAATRSCLAMLQIFVVLTTCLSENYISACKQVGIISKSGITKKAKHRGKYENIHSYKHLLLVTNEDSATAPTSQQSWSSLASFLVISARNSFLQKRLCCICSAPFFGMFDCLEKTDLEDLDPVDQIPHNSRDLGPILGSMSWGDMFFLQGTHCIPEEKKNMKKTNHWEI